MIARPGARVDEDRVWPVGSGAVRSAAGLDFAAAEANVTRWGGRVSVFRSAVAAGLAAATEADRDTAAAVGTLAGWRSGVLELRAEALVVAAGWSHPGRDRVVAAVLGLATERLPDFLSRQAASALAWPGWPPTAVVQRVGGFLGLGGVWAVPPVATIAGAGPDEALIRCADGRWWVLRADVFGARLRLSADPVTFDAGPAVGVLVWPTSYLVRVTGEAW